MVGQHAGYKTVESTAVSWLDQMRDLMHQDEVDKMRRKLEQCPMERDFRGFSVGTHPPPQPEIADIGQGRRSTHAPRPLRDMFGQPVAPFCGVPQSDLLTGSSRTS